MTSWNWLYLSDFSSSFKPTSLPEDNPANFSYFFDTAGRRTCYLAPERFLPPGSVPDPAEKVTWAMDIFSAGCVIAELFLETPIFNLSQMFKYRKGEFDPVSFHLYRIADKDVRDLIANMIALDPTKRDEADGLLKHARNKVFPEYFYSFLHQYMALVTDPSSGRFPVSSSTSNLGEADERIDRLYYDFDKISYFLGYENDKPTSQSSTLSRTGLGLFPVQLNIPNNEHHAIARARRPSDDGTLIFLSLVISSLRNTARAQGRIRACDLLLAFAERLTDEAKLDRILPYLIALLHDETDIVKIAALRSLTQLLSLVTVISPVNANVFPEYILKQTRDFVLGSEKTPNPLVRATYAGCIGSLATTASRFLNMVATLRADGTLPTADPDLEDGETTTTAVYHDLFDNARNELIEIFEDHTKSLITDRDSAVRRAFLESVPELCLFFGTAELNDIILSHLNTYLNDRDWMLKCAFFDNIVGVATFLGGTSLEEFILPLMVQALTDPEEFVVERVLRSLANMADLGLFQRSRTWELIDVVARFTMHPNIWIREASAMFISSSTKFLSQADHQCIILPLIRPYMKAAIKNFTELELLDTLKKPLSRQVLDLASQWVTRTDRGIFWKSASQLQTFSFGVGLSNMPIVSSKDSGHSGLKQLPRNEEDEQWLSRLRTMGMTADDEFKLVALREYIWRTVPQKLREVSNQGSTDLSNIIKLTNKGITLQTVLFDDKKPLDDPLRPIKPELEGGERGHTIADALLDASMTIDDSIARRRKTAFNAHRARSDAQNPTSLMALNGVDTGANSSVTSSPASPSPMQGALPDARRNGSMAPPQRPLTRTFSDDASSIASTERALSGRQIRHQSSAISLLNKGSSKSNAETGTTSANAFGKVEGPFTQMANQPSALVMAKDREEAAQANDVRFRAAHSYNGNDPSVLQMLDSMYIENYPNDIVEFGPLVQPMSRRKTITRSTAQSVTQPWRPQGILVATFSEHIGPVNRIAVAPDHVFFITGGDDGSVKVWDTARLERNIAHRSRQTHRHPTGANITTLCFVENTHCFVSTGSDGSIHVVKVEYLFSPGVGSTSRYGKLRLLREHQLPNGEFAVWSEHFRLETHSTLIIATNRSRILAVDLRNMKVLYELLNPVHHGTPTCFVIDRKRHWLLLGTSHGILSLWDLRFKVRLRAWGIPGASCIYRLVIHPFKGRGKWVCVAGGSGQGEVSVWDIEKVQCREVYRCGGSRESPKGYEAWTVDEDRPEGMLGRFATALEPASGSTDRGVRAMVAGIDSAEDGRDSGKYGFLVTGGSDKKIRFWDLARVESSLVVSGLDVDEPKPTFTASHPTAALTVNTERVPRKAPSEANAGEGTRRGNVTGGGSSATGSNRPPRSSVISAQQQQLLRNHLDSILDVALLESPYGMTVSVDRSGCTYVFQ